MTVDYLSTNNISQSDIESGDTPLLSVAVTYISHTAMHYDLYTRCSSTRLTEKIIPLFTSSSARQY